MRITRPPHRWAVSPQEAAAIQERLARAINQTTPAGPLRYLAGVDAAFTSDFCVAGAVLWDRQTGETMEHHTAVRRLTFPYIPGLLTFREAPAILSALRRLRRLPDALLCDGQGIAHPRRCGLASHLGLLSRLPAVGCAKTRLIGAYRPPAESRGSRSPLVLNDEILGAVLRTRERVKPVFVSVGHAIDLETAVEVVLACGRGFRIPEPLRLADQLVRRAKRPGISQSGR